MAIKDDGGDPFLIFTAKDFFAAKSLWSDCWNHNEDDTRPWGSLEEEPPPPHVEVLLSDSSPDYRLIICFSKAYHAQRELSRSDHGDMRDRSQSPFTHEPKTNIDFKSQPSRYLELISNGPKAFLRFFSSSGWFPFEAFKAKYKSG